MRTICGVLTPTDLVLKSVRPFPRSLILSPPSDVFRKRTSHSNTVVLKAGRQLVESLFFFFVFFFQF